MVDFGLASTKVIATSKWVCVTVAFLNTFHRHHEGRFSKLIKVTGEGLEPSTNGLTYLIGSHRPRENHSSGLLLVRSCVESLDYIPAIAGVPRVVSEAETDDPPVPCLLITQSLVFSNLHACRYRRRCGVKGSQGCSSK